MKLMKADLPEKLQYGAGHALAWVLKLLKMNNH
jgi:hypothetical protein